MAIELNLNQDSFISVSKFRELLPDSSLDEISNGVLKHQVVPKIYLSINNINFDLKQVNNIDSNLFPVLAIPGYSLIILSYKKEIAFIIQQLNSFVESIYDPIKCNYYPFLILNRKNISNYEKHENVNFNAIKPKLALSLAVDASRKGVGGGLIQGLIMKSIVHSIDKHENDFILTEGIKYSLSYSENSINKTIEIIAHQSAINSIDKFLLEQWKKDEPVSSDKKKEGCYIATCCYKSYDHPSVLVLRNFRDNYLLKKQTGQIFVEIYYKYSPKIAIKISQHKIINFLIKELVLNPFVLALKFFNI